MCLRWNLVLKIIEFDGEYAEFDGDICFFCFEQEIPGKFGPKYQNCLLKMKLST